MKIFSLKDEAGYIHHLNLEQVVEIFPFKEVEYSILSELEEKAWQKVNDYYNTHARFRLVLATSIELEVNNIVREQSKKYPKIDKLRLTFSNSKEIVLAMSYDKFKEVYFK